MRKLARCLWRWLWWWLLAAWCGTAAAASYTFRADTYAWESSSNTLTWDRSCTGYPGDDDKATISFSGGFRFRFGGTDYTSVRVLTNGMLAFGSDAGTHRLFDNTTLPAGSAGSYGFCAAGSTARVMMPYWTDLDPSRGSATVTWQQKGSTPNRYVVISWNNVYEYGTSTAYTFQVILYENGEFKYQYGNANTTGSNATIGVQVGSSDYTLYSYNSGYRSAGTAIRWGPPDNSPMRVAEYRFDEQAYDGTVGEATDSTGNGHGGTRRGSVDTTASGYVCRGLQVPADTSSASQALDTALDVPGALGDQGSINFWYRANGAWGAGSDTQLFDASMLSGRSFHLVRRSNGTLRFAVTDSGGSTQTADSPGYSFAAGTWVHIAATWSLVNASNGSALKLYVNGTLVATRTATTTGTLDQGLGTLYLGDSRNNVTSNNATVNSADGRFDELRIYNYAQSATEVEADRTATHACPVTLHHLEIRHASGSGLTCTPATLTLVACNDASCASLYTGGVTGTLAASGSGMAVNWPAGAAFSIPAGASSVDLAMHLATAGSVVLSASGLSPAPPNATSCNFGSPACTFSASDSGFVFNVPHHVAEVAQAVTVAAVKKSDSGSACVPAFASTSKPVTFSCAYANPASGTQPVRVGGSALNAAGNTAAACDGSGRALTLAFNAAGVASTTVQYADVGAMTLAARYSGSGADAGLVMTGADSFTAAPASFAFSAISAGPLRAGSPFAATVTARNNTGTTTPNFGRESPAEGVALSFARAQPTGAGAANGSFSGSLGAFSGGVASASNLAWSEVGRIDLTATLASASYLGTGLSASGSTGSAGAVGRFTPHHFDLLATPACGSFSYAGQPFTTTVIARNAAGATTANYHGAFSPGFAQALTLQAAGSVAAGSFSGHTLAATAFAAGVASASPAYTFTDKQTPAQTLTLRAVDADGISSAGFTEPAVPLRSGRLRLADATGSERSALRLPAWAEYWSGSAWVPNSADSCTSVPAGAVALSNRRDARGSATGAWSNSVSAVTLAAGSGVLTLGAPSPAAAGSTGSVDVALNLGHTSADQSCLAAHPPSTGAGLPWLRGRLGACSASADRDPAARAGFGVYSPETKRTVHVRDLF